MSESKPEKKSSKPIKPQIVGEEDENPTWYKVAMFGFMILGLIWILVFYISSARYPLGSATPINLSNWNILVGINFALGLFVPGISWEGHLGGLVTGLVIAGIYAATRKPNQKLLQATGIAAVWGAIYLLTQLRIGMWF